jgi:membrane-bound lytic murein transglycosylase B
VRWWLLAGIGLVESGHARSGGSVAARWNGIARPPIYGPRLDGRHGFAAIHDTDRGVIDHDKLWDRAVGPMQFLPSTWRTWGGTDKHGRIRDPQDIRAAALAAAGYLCAGGADLSQAQGMAAAVYSYNHSFDYVRLVLSVAAKYAGLNPDALGVNKLPHDKPAAKKGKAGATGASPAASPSASAGGSSSTSASPSPSSSSHGSPSPSPSPSGPSIPPLPTPTSVFH